MLIDHWKIFVFVVFFAVLAYVIFPKGQKLSEMYMKSYQWEESFKIIEQELKKDPDNPRLIKDMAQYLEAQGEQEQELRLYEKLVTLRPHNTQYQGRLAQLYRWSNRPNDELKQLEEIANFAPNDVYTHERLADFYHWHKKLDQALPHHVKLIELEPKNPYHYLDLADAYMNLKRTDEGIAVYEKLIQKFPNNAEYHFIVGDVYEWRNHLKDALREYLAYLDLRFPKLSISKKLFQKPLHFTHPLNDKDIEVLDHIVIILTEQKKNKDAEKMFQSLEASFPTQPQWVEKRAKFYVATDHLDAALELYQALSKKNPQELSYDYEIAQIYVWKDQVKKAFQIYQKLVKQDPTSSKAHLELARLYAALNEPEKAYQEYVWVLEQEPDNEQALEGVAQASLWTQRLEKGAETYRKLIARHPQKEEYRRGLGLLYFWLGAYGEAQGYLVAYAQNHPRDWEVNMALIQSYNADQQYERAYTLLQEMDTPVLKDRQKNQVDLMRGALYDAIDEPDRSEKIYRNMLKKEPGLQEAKRALVPILYDKKDYFEAHHLAKELKDDYALWIQEEAQKQTALKTKTKFDWIETIDKKSTLGEYSYNYEGVVSKYLWNRWEGKGRYHYATVKDTSLTPLLHMDISTVGAGLNYDVTRALKAGLEPQLYNNPLWTTLGMLGELQWHATDTLYFDLTSQFHKLWTNPLDSVRYKAVQDGGDLYFDYKPFERLNVIGSGGFNVYSLEHREGQGWARTGTFKTLVTFWLKPKIEGGYFFDYQHAWQNQKLSSTSPLVRRIAAHYIMGQFDYSPLDTFRIFINGAIGEDQERQLTLGEAALYQYLFKGEWRISDRLSFEGVYSYSSQSSQTGGGIQEIAMGQLSYSFH